MTKQSSKLPTSSKSILRKNSPRLTPFVRAFLKRVQNTVTTESLWGKKEHFIIAVSGGGDSLCLLDVLFLLSKKYDFKLHIAHVNYRLRQEDSALDEALVRERAAFYKLPLTVLHPKKTTSSNLEEKLRDIRYHFLETVRKKEQATLIAVAHHEDDQAETFLLRLLRGSGMTGLSAMRPKHGYIIRPLIKVSRQDILRYLKERGVTYRTDGSNSDAKFLRNRLRHELLPLLEKEYQPKVRKILADTAALLASDYAILETLSSPHTDTKEFSAQALLALPEPVLKTRLRFLLKPYYKGKAAPKGLIEEILKLLKSHKGKIQTLSFRGLKIERKGDTVRLLNF